MAAAQINWTGREGEQPTASEKTDHPPNERVAAAEAGLPRLHTHPHTHWHREVQPVGIYIISVRFVVVRVEIKHTHAHARLECERCDGDS